MFCQCAKNELTNDMLGVLMGGSNGNWYLEFWWTWKLKLDLIFVQKNVGYGVSSQTLREKCPNTEFFLVTEYEEIRSICPYSVRMRQNTDEKKLRIWTLFT